MKKSLFGKVLYATALLITLTVSFIMIAHDGAHAQSSAESEISARLNEVLSNQKAILEELAAIKEELRIIKIRVTQSQ